jgi:DNA polymerase-3 subunit delta
MAGFPLKLPAGPRDVLPAYFIYGEDIYPGREFVRELRKILTEVETGEAQVETFDLVVRGWGDVLDAAKSVPFLFSPWRILVVEGKGAGQEDLSSGEAAAFRDYFASPSPRTVIVVLFDGKIHKTKPLAKAFAALPDSVIATVEILPLKDKDLAPMVQESFEALGKRATSEAVACILDITESDFARIASEVEKISIYIGPKTTIEADDVSALASVKNFENWELTAALEENSIERALVVLESLFDDGIAPQLIVGTIVGFFRNLLLARTRLREGRDPKDVFREIKPQISEKFGSFYQRKLGEYLSFLGRITDADVLRWLTDLERIDRRIKTTDVSPKGLIQAFLIGFDQSALGRRVTSPGRR